MHTEPTRVTNKRNKDINVWAGPLGFSGHALGLWLGPVRNTIEEAQKDAELAADCIKKSPLGVLV